MHKQRPAEEADDGHFSSVRWVSLLHRPQFLLDLKLIEPTVGQVALQVSVDRK